jgi:hypothetical protein
VSSFAALSFVEKQTSTSTNLVKIDPQPTVLKQECRVPLSSGVKAVEKREGGGARNWGRATDNYE